MNLVFKSYIDNIIPHISNLISLNRNKSYENSIIILYYLMILYYLIIKISINSIMTNQTRDAEINKFS